MNPKLIMLGGMGLIILAITTWGFYERSAKLSIQADYDGFVADAKAIAAAQLAERLRKEKEDEERIKRANADRAIALERLRLATANSGRLRATIHTLTASRSGQVCFREQGFATALSGITGLVTEGEVAIVNSRALLDSWPK